MNILFTILMGVSPLALFLAVVRSRLELNNSKSGYWGCRAVIFLSLFLLAMSFRIIPGGPFVSIRSDIFPAMSCLGMLFFAARGFRAASAAQRVRLSFLAFVSLGIIMLVIADVAEFCCNHFARGALFGW